MNIIESIKNLLGSQDVKLDALKVKLEAFKTADGKSLEVAALEVGEAVTIDGEAATEGDITLEDGRILAIDAEGKISEIKDAPADESTTEEAPIEAAELAEDAPAEPSVDLEARIADLEAALMMIAEEVNQLKGEKTQTDAELSAIKEENNQLKSENEALKVKPAAQPAKFSKVEIKSEEKIGRFAGLIRQARNN